MHVIVDGAEVPRIERFRFRTKVFDLTLPEGNLAGAPAGTLLAPAVDDGFYVMLKPLPVGPHSLRIIGLDDQGAGVDVTYNLTIVDVDLRGE